MFPRILLICALLFYTSIAIYDVISTHSVSREAIIYDGISREILATTTEGRQALVGSIYMPPLNALLRLPFTAFLSNFEFPLSSIFVSLIFGIASILLMDAILKTLNVGWQRLLFAGAFMLNPIFYNRCIDGSSATTTIFLMILILYGIYGWISTRDVKFIVYYAISTGLLILISFETLLLLLFAILLVTLHELLRHGTKSEKGAVILMILLPFLYAVGFWLLMNWLIMSDWFYFLRGLFFSIKSKPETIPYSLSLSSYHIGTVIISFIVMFVSAFNGNRAGIFVSAMTVAPLPLAIARINTGLVHQSDLLIQYIPTLAIVSTGLACSILRQQNDTATKYVKSFSSLQIVAGVILFILTAITSLHHEPIRKASSQKLLSFDDVLISRNKELPALTKHVTSVSKYVKVLVCGYDSFILLGHNKDKIFVRTMDFNLNKARHDYTGHLLFVLLKQPDIHSVADSNTWKHPHAFEMGIQGALYDSDWGKWRLFEVIRSSHRVPQKNI